MPVNRFEIPGHATRREFAVYVVIARRRGGGEFYLYVGKTGDNRDGCNPVISRAGNHFSYNDIHSQVRNKLPNHEEYNYNYLYITFDPFDNDETIRKSRVNVVNEMERVVNACIQNILHPSYKDRLLNPYVGAGYVTKDERSKRTALRTTERMTKVKALVTAVVLEINSFAPDAIKRNEST